MNLKPRLRCPTEWIPWRKNNGMKTNIDESKSNGGENKKNLKGSFLSEMRKALGKCNEDELESYKLIMKRRRVQLIREGD